MSDRLYGIAEISDALSRPKKPIRRQTVAQWNFRSLLPPPDGVLRMGPYWYAETIEPWIEQWKKENA